eukprot:1804532-Rhodomonas_salina.5
MSGDVLVSDSQRVFFALVLPSMADMLWLCDPKSAPLIVISSAAVGQLGPVRADTVSSEKVIASVRLPTILPPLPVVKDTMWLPPSPARTDVDSSDTHFITA